MLRGSKECSYLKCQICHYITMPLQCRLACLLFKCIDLFLLIRFNVFAYET